MKLTVSHASRPKIGETVNGDAVVFRRSDTRALAAVIDALGHGPTAAAVAHKASFYLESVPLESDVRSILNGLHAALRGGRGAAAMVCAIEPDRLEGCGVGNVELRISAGQVPVVLSPGVLGGTVRNLRVFHGRLYMRSRIVLFSDGVSARFQLDSLRDLPAQQLSEYLIGQQSRDYDDATALVVDYEG
jgi:negative regulator of sigma-B (phosphoserine phosphatase)